MLFMTLFTLISMAAVVLAECFSEYKHGYLPAAIIGAIFGLIVSGAILIITSV